MMILPRGEMLAVILPLVIVPPVESGSILMITLVDDNSGEEVKAQSWSEGSEG
jgi:hypothetical protein